MLWFSKSLLQLHCQPINGVLLPLSLPCDHHYLWPSSGFTTCSQSTPNTHTQAHNPCPQWCHNNLLNTALILFNVNHSTSLHILQGTTLCPILHFLLSPLLKEPIAVSYSRAWCFPCQNYPVCLSKIIHSAFPRQNYPSCFSEVSITISNYLSAFLKSVWPSCLLGSLP